MERERLEWAYIIISCSEARMRAAFAILFRPKFSTSEAFKFFTVDPQHGTLTSQIEYCPFKLQQSRFAVPSLCTTTGSCSDRVEAQ